MNVRLKCVCGTNLTVDQAACGHLVACSKCGRKLRVPEAVRKSCAATASRPESVSFITEDPSERASAEKRATPARPSAIPPAVPPLMAVPLSAAPTTATLPSDAAPTAWHGRRVSRSGGDESRMAWWKWVLLLLVFLVPAGVVGVLIALPYFRTKDPREQVAQRYLDAIRRDDWPEANRLSVLTAHPRLTGVERVALDEQKSTVLPGKFQGLREFHSRIDQQYRYNADRGRFEPKDELGLGLGVLSKLEQAKKKAEEKLAENAADPARKKQNPEDQMLDDALARYGVIGELATSAGGLLSSQKLGPTYEDLLKETDVPLSESERLLAEHFMHDPAKWQRLLGRSFLELPDLGQFELHEVQLQAIIRTEGQSLGEPGRPITLHLVRFTMGSIDTGWRVWQAE